MADSDFDAFSSKRLTDKELKIMVKVLSLAKELTEDDDEDWKGGIMEMLDNMIYNATEIKKIMETQ